MIALLFALSALIAEPGAAASPLRTPVAAHAAQDIDDLETQLRSNDERERRTAVQELVALGSEEAWDLVLDALEDPFGQVADEAQLALPGLPIPLWTELTGKRGLKSKADHVPLRVAEALGRFPEALDEKVFVAALDHKDPDVRRSVLWSCERLGYRKELSSKNGKVVDAIRALASKDKVPAVRAQALVALATIDPGAIQPLALEFAIAKDAVMRAAAAEMIQYLPGSRRLSSAQWARQDPAFVVRLRAYDAVAGLGERAAVAFLVESLGLEERLRLRWRLVEHLRSSSGLKHGLDERPWKDWLERLPEDWTPERGGEESELGDEETASFAGLPVLSDRVSFLIDFSGSMWEERDGKTRKERVDAELRTALERLDPEVKFNLLPFAARVLQWQKSLTGARPRDVGKALKWFEGCKESGTGDYWSAMKQALVEPGIDTMIVLGDGAPSGGHRWNIDLMKELWRHENRFYGVAVDALLIGAKGRVRRGWGELCETSGGRVLDVEL